MPSLTRLEAVNRILTGSGLTAVSTLTGPEVSPDALNAETFLDEAYHDLSTQDWKYNTLINQTYSPNVDGEIVMDNIAYVEFNDEYEEDHQPVLRGNKVFDRVNNTYVWDKDILCRKVVEDVPFELSPPAFQLYVIKVAENTFVGTQLGEPGQVRHTQETLQRAFMALVRYRIRTHNGALMSVPSILERGTHPSGHRISYMAHGYRRGR